MLRSDVRALVIRADANPQMGTGHLMRCLALAQAWKDTGGEVAFVTACESAGLPHRLSDEGFEVVQVHRPYPDPVDWETTTRVLREHPGAWVVLDGYHFGSSFQRTVKETGHPLLVIDDMAHLDHYYADVILNQNLHATDLAYRCEPSTQLLLGTKYVLLRQEFLKWRDWKREIPEVARKVLITLGGGDRDNVTLQVVRAINELELEGLEARIVIGPSNRHIASLEAVARHSPFAIHLLPFVEDMPELMAWADVAVSAGGSTCWEMAFMGLPAVLVVVAKNQCDIGKGLSESGVVHNLGWFEQVTDAKLVDALSGLLADPDRRSMMGNRGQELVDGLGCERVLEIQHAGIH